MDEQMILRQMEHFGDLYRRDFLNEKKLGMLSFNNTEKLTDSWWYGVLAFFGVSFLQGRRDELSNKFIARLKIALELFFPGNEEEKRDKLKTFCGTISSELFLKVKNDCRKKDELDDFSKILCEQGVNRGRDRKMVLHTLMFINGLVEYDNNIVSYTKTMLENGKVEELNSRLQKIHSVGPKIASMWIRDLITIFGLEELVGAEVDYSEYIFPVDTWVEQFYRFFKGMKKDDRKNAVSRQELVIDMIKYCKLGDLNALKVNQGIWYSSKHPWVVISECYKLNGSKR